MDRVSSLPDEVLSHILSFLPTKEAALTSVLSKRWRNLLAFVPNLVIDDSVFLHPEEGKREREQILQSFIDFVDRVLALQGDSPIKKFSLKCKSNDSVCMNRWICNVLQRGVSDLELFVVRGYSYVSSLSHEAFVRRTKWSPGANFTFSPKLKTLVIDPSGIFSDKIETLLQAFPALQELDLHRFHWSGSGETVSSASLKKLTIYASSCEVFINPKSVSFDTPSLLYLEYSDFVSEDYPILNLANLVEARLNLMAHEGQIKLIRGLNIEDDEVDDVQPCGNVWKLMSAIRNVQKLRLSHDTLEVFSLCFELMPVFNNLKWLRIDSCVGWGWQGMPVLLRNCPHLETLVLVGLLHYVTVKCGDACDCISREDKGRSLISCPVKKIQIKGFRGRKREMEMIKHFLEYFSCLKEMEIYPTDSEVPEIFELIVKMVNLYNENYRVVMFTSCCVIYCVGSAVQ